MMPSHHCRAVGTKPLDHPLIIAAAVTSHHCARSVSTSLPCHRCLVVVVVSCIIVTLLLLHCCSCHRSRCHIHCWCCHPVVMPSQSFLSLCCYYRGRCHLHVEMWYTGKHRCCADRDLLQQQDMVEEAQGRVTTEH